MADTDLPVEGRHVSIVLIVNGAPVRVVDQVTNFEANAQYNTITTEPLGTTRRHIDKYVTGWSGTLTLASSRATVDDVMDVIHAAAGLSSAVSAVSSTSDVQIREVVRYRDGSARTYLYREVKLELQTSNQRNQARQTTLNWESGVDRTRI